MSGIAGKNAKMAGPRPNVVCRGGGWLVLKVIVLLSLTHSQVHGQDTLTACAAIGDNAARLNCYDRVVGRAEPAVSEVPDPARAGVVTAPESAPARPEEPAPDPESFGLEQPRQQAEESGQDYVYTVASASRSQFTGWTITFDNGQVWRQLGTDRYTIKVGETYTISEASFDSFMLGNAESNRRIRVSRVR